MIDLSNKGGCIEDYNNAQVPIAVASEKGKSYRLTNNLPRWNLTKYKGECLVNNSTKACDYLFVIEKQKRKKIFLIELKGSDVHQAVLQILSMLKFLQINRNSAIESVHGRIVPSSHRAPSVQTNEYKKLRIVLNSLNGELVHQNKTLSESI